MGLVSNNDDSGLGSLRDAIAIAKSGDTITFDQSLNGKSIKLTSELLIDKDLTIAGLGSGQPTISGGKASRVFRIAPGARVTIYGLRITDGKADAKAPPAPGETFPGWAGGILNQGDLTLDQVIVANCKAVGDASKTIDVCGRSLTGTGGGGGALNLSKLKVFDSTFEGNHAEGDLKSNNLSAGGNNTFPGAAGGGALANVGMADALVINCQFRNNRALAGHKCNGTGSAKNNDPTGNALGGAITNFGFSPKGAPNKASLAVSGSHFSNNQAVGGDKSVSAYIPGHAVGGAIASHRFQGSADLQVSKCTFEDNQSRAGSASEVPQGQSGEPGSAVAGAVFVCGTGTIDNSDFCNNEARGGTGAASGAVLDGGDGAGGAIALSFDNTLVTVSNCTVTGNWARGGEPGPCARGGNGLGGGIRVAGAGTKLTVIGGSIDQNEALGGAESNGHGIGGGLYNCGTVIGPSLTKSISNNYASTSDPDIANYAGTTPSSEGDGLGGGVFIAKGSTMILNTPLVSITQNRAEDFTSYQEWQESNCGELSRVVRELLHGLDVVTKPPSPPPSPWLQQWQAQWDNVMTALGGVRLDPADYKAEECLNATRREFDAAAELVRSACSASVEEQAKLVKNIATQAEIARASFDQLVQAVRPPRERGESAPAISAAHQ